MSVKLFTTEVLTSADTNTYLRNGVVAIFVEAQANGTSAGSSVATTYTKRTLNTTITNQITGCSIASSVITLTAGTYLVRAYAPFVFCNNVKLRWRNTTAGSTIINGTSNYAGSGTINTLEQVFTITGSTNFELQYYGTVAQAGYGLGIASSSGDTEVYSVVTIFQIGA
jgi:hypothetical protein